MTIAFPLLFKLLPGKEYRAMAFWPFIFLKDNVLIHDEVIMNHEKIHLTQQKELLVIPFYLLYFSEYILHRLSKKNHEQAYLKISFEQEAYKFDKDLTYLKKRKLWASFRSN